MSSGRQYSGAVLRAHLSWLEKNAMKAAVRERVPADTQALFDKPPLAISWLPGRHVEALLEATFAVGGEQKVVQLGQQSTSSQLGLVVRPILQTLMSLFGASPAVLFSRIDASLPLFVKGAAFTYDAVNEREGVMRLRTAERASSAFYALWKGVLAFAFEMASATGAVESCEIDADGKGAAYRVAWSA